MADDPRGRLATPVVGLDSEEGFRALVELSPDAVFVILDGYHVFANARGLALLGARDLAELQSQPAVEYMHPSCRIEARDRMHTMVGERAPLAYVEERIVRRDGIVLDIEAAGTPIEVAGRPAALIVVRDITARKQAEAALQAAHLRFQAAFRYAPSAIALVELDGRIGATNPALGRILGCSSESVRGTVLWDLAQTADRSAVRASFRRLSQGVALSVSGDFRFLRPDRSTGWLHARANRLAGEAMFVVHLLDVTAAKQTEEELAHRATRDPLTGLDNRTQLLGRLTAALRTPDHQVCVLFCDLDGFKQINDRYGHAVGDHVLIAVSRRMRAAVCLDDPIGRIGGDEFAVVLTGPSAGDQAEQIAERISAAVREPLAIGGQLLRLSVSIGVATASDVDASAEQLLAAADASMYEDKASHARAESLVTTGDRRPLASSGSANDTARGVGQGPGRNDALRGS